MSYEEEVKKLAPLETFDAGAFVGNDEYPQSLCDFMLSLALAYNDLRDVTLARILFDSIPIPGNDLPTTARGQYGGLRLILTRVQIGLINELFRLVESSRQIVDDPSFGRVCKPLSKQAKFAWNIVCEVAMRKGPSSELARLLVRIRNKVAFHYDAEELSKGFQRYFMNRERPTPPFISRGDNLIGTRFYFADAAVESYFNLRINPNDQALIDLLWGGGELLDSVNLALNEIVTRFIQSRSSYRKYY